MPPRRWLGALSAISGCYSALSPLEQRLNGCEMDAVLNDSGTDGVASETGGVVDIEFVRQEMPAMFLDGLDADAEFHCGLFVGVGSGDWFDALSNRVEHFVHSWPWHQR